MTTSTRHLWEDKRTEETRMVEDLLGRSFEQVDAYRYNSASIRLRVVDSRFEGLRREERDAMVEPQIEQLLPRETQRDIITLLTLTPAELEQTPWVSRPALLNREFDDPSPSDL